MFLITMTLVKRTCNSRVQRLRAREAIPNDSSGGVSRSARSEGWREDSGVIVFQYDVVSVSGLLSLVLLEIDFLGLNKVMIIDIYICKIRIHVLYLEICQ